VNKLSNHSRPINPSCVIQVRGDSLYSRQKQHETQANIKPYGNDANSSKRRGKATKPRRPNHWAETNGVKQPIYRSGPERSHQPSPYNRDNHRYKDLRQKQYDPKNSITTLLPPSKKADSDQAQSGRNEAKKYKQNQGIVKRTTLNRLGKDLLIILCPDKPGRTNTVPTQQ